MPKYENLQTNKICLRLTDEEKAALKQHAKLIGSPQAALVRRIVLSALTQWGYEV